MRVTVIHLDLGIGGAERLVVNTCCALQELGYELHIVTSHHDQNHCFEETKIGGRLASHIHVYGDWLPRHILGRGTAFFSILRMLYLSILVSIYQLFSRHKEHVVFIDGVSAPIPFLKFAGLAVFFYCHFPDKLLCVDRGGPLKRSYRYIVDAIEENTTGCADIIACNSTFTSYEFRLAFKILSQQCIPYILNPTVEDDLLVDDYLIRKKEKNRKGIEFIEGTDVMFLSINRYERAKRIDLALNAIRLLKDRVAGNYKNTHLKVTLVVAGGYDSQVRENKEYLQELKDLAKRLDIQDDVVFRTSISKDERFALISAASALIYTPGREHFGIVPIEAMALGTPVIAVASGGPLETVNQGATGFLCAQQPLDFANNMMRFVIDKNLSFNMAEACRRHVAQRFTSDVLRAHLQKSLERCLLIKDNDRSRFFVRKCAFNILSVLVVLLLPAYRIITMWQKFKSIGAVLVEVWKHINKTLIAVPMGRDRRDFPPSE